MLGFGWLQCRHTRPALWDYASERLSEGPMEIVEKHLQACAVCRREVESLRNAQNFLSACRAEEEPAPSSDWNALRQRLLTQSPARLPEPAMPRRHARSAPAILRPADRDNARAPWQMQLLTSMAGGFAAVGIVALGYGLLMHRQAVAVPHSGAMKPVDVPYSTNSIAMAAVKTGSGPKSDINNVQMIGHVVDILNNARVGSATTTFASVKPVRNAQSAPSGALISVSHKPSVAFLPRIASGTPHSTRRPNTQLAAGRVTANHGNTRIARSESKGLPFRHYTPRPEDRLPNTEQTASRYALEQVRPVGNDSDDSNVYVVGTVQPASQNDDHDF